MFKKLLEEFKEIRNFKINIYKIINHLKNIKETKIKNLQIKSCFE